ncbi:uncharacterized protein LOC127130003 [Lathyrus oleraceus]|uniref:uncharacterized protein LOC127130003 n=1 Tax=Pisum sativum TaxID=3888 RepID=UPI0021CF825E|nr:uncharacterized protein LOC127130003 [Pisum sativum]
MQAQGSNQLPAQTVVNPRDSNTNVPKYAKFLKDLCTNKRRIKGSERVNLGRNISAFIQPKPSSEKVTGEKNVSAITQLLPQKQKDPGTFTVPCTIGDSKFENCMLDLGAGISVIPTSIYNNLNLGPLQHTGLIVQLTNKSNARLTSVVEDVLVQIDAALQPDTFPIGEVVADEAVFGVDALDIPAAPSIPKIEQPPSLELKQLPENLKYAYLETNEKLLVIIYSNLDFDQEEKLMQVLKKHKKAIGWTLADLPGISPSMCMHMILLEDGAKIVRQPQRRLNPLILDVVKKEVTKLLQAGVIYPISDSKWVSPVQDVPKKSGLTMVKNEKNELVPTKVQNNLRVWNCIGSYNFRKSSVDLAKIDVISTLPYPSCIRKIRSFLGHAGFYRRFIKDFSKIALPLLNLLKNDVTFNFDDKCKQAFDFLKKALTSAPIIQPPDWTLPFEIMCDASNYAVGVVLEQRVDRAAHVVYYASRTLDSAQSNYTTIDLFMLIILMLLEFEMVEY